MAKRQAFEVAAEIEAKWRQRRRCMVSAWSYEHITWLIQRWNWKNPSQVAERQQVESVIHESVAGRLNRGITVNWLYVFSGHMRAMMHGAGLKVDEPKPVEHGVETGIIELKAR